MANVETTLVTLLDSSIKCYPLEKPQGVTAPVVVYKRLTTRRMRVYGVKSTFNAVRMAISVYGVSYTAVKSAVSTINGLLDENITNFSSAVLIEQKDFRESDSNLYHTYLEYMILAHLD